MSNKKPQSGITPKLGSAAKAIVEKLRKNGGWGKFDRKAGFINGKLILPGLMLNIRLQDLKELSHPSNPTPFLIEFVRIGQDDYLRVVSKPPSEARNALDADGKWTYEATNDIRPLLDTWMSQPVPTLYKGKTIDNLFRHPKNPFRNGSGYGTLVDIIAWADPGILKEPLLKIYCTVTGKSEKRAKFDLAVIESAQRGKPRHKSCRSGFVIHKNRNAYSIEFE